MLEEDNVSDTRLVIMTIKYQNQTFQVDMESGTLVSDLKEKLHDLIELPFDRQRLIYNGRILKDSEYVDDLEDATVRVVKLAENQLVELESGSHSASTSKAAGLEDSQLKYLKRMMDSPIMKQLTSNQDFLKSMFNNNPQMKKLFEDNPELEHIMNDPSMMKDAVEMMRNPSYQREMMRNQDRALSNIEMLPEGFNALRRTYSTIQKPMFDALDESTKATVKEEKGIGIHTPNKLNKNPLPNPWAAPRRLSHSSSSLPSSLPSSWLPFPTPPSNESNTSSFQERSLLNAMMQQRRESRNSQGGPSSASGSIGNNSGHPMGSLSQRRPSLSELQLTFANANLTAYPIPSPSSTSSTSHPPPSLSTFTPSHPFQPAYIRAPPLPSKAETEEAKKRSSQSPSSSSNLARIDYDDEEASNRQNDSSYASPPLTCYESELQTLHYMGFTNRQDNLNALSESNGNIQLAIEKLLRQMK